MGGGEGRALVKTRDSVREIDTCIQVLPTPDQ